MTQDDKADPVMRAFPHSKALLLSELEKVLEATKYQPPTSHEGQLHITAVQLRALLLAEPYRYKPEPEQQDKHLRRALANRPLRSPTLKWWW